MSRYSNLKRMPVPQFRAASTDARATSPHVMSTISLRPDGIANPLKTGFYKSFGRPIAKVFLGAMFTYQITYLLWLKLETQEVKASKTAQSDALELRLNHIIERTPDVSTNEAAPGPK